VVLAGDGRIFIPCPDSPSKPLKHPIEHREQRERLLLAQAAGSIDVDIRWRFLQARARINDPEWFPSGLGIIANLVQTGPDGVQRVAVVPACSTQVKMSGSERWSPGLMFMMLRDPQPRIREEAAIGLQVLLGEEEYPGALATLIRDEIDACIRIQNDSRPTVVDRLGERATVTTLLLESLGIVKYGSDDDRTDAERLLVQHLRRPPYIYGALRGLEALFRQSPNRPILLETRVKLRELTQYGSRFLEPPPNPMEPRIRRLAFMALRVARDEDTATLGPAADDVDWQVRRLIAQQLNLSDPEHARIAARFAEERVFQVRYELLGPISREATRTHNCADVVKYIDDPSPVVAMRAIDALSPSCTDLEDQIEKLIKLADGLREGDVATPWHKPLRALSALARLKPEEARKRLPLAANHALWQVRAAAVTAAVSLNASSILTALSQDKEPNVRTAVIVAMVRMKHPGLRDAAINALMTSVDNQLVFTAASALSKAPEAESHEPEIQALFEALRKLTQIGEDTSRDSRVAILDTLGPIVGRDRAGRFQPWIDDFDPEVSRAGVKAWYATGIMVPPVIQRKRRYPYQPAEDVLTRLVPTEMTLRLDEGTVVISLRPEIAPVTIARVATLARSRYYDGLTFHRVVPNFVVQGGSPAANEYAGTTRFMRDELGAAPHIRGAVGISTRGRDTGDGQFFIDLVDLPSLDRNYTVIGYVTSGMEIVDRMLEGTIIKNVQVR
jgi:cyclophilin family peptidyl-prolyl cis-trans isomerase